MSEPTTTLIDLDAILSGAAATEFLPDAFGPGRGVYIRPFTADEYEKWRDYAGKRAGKSATTEKRNGIVEFCQMGACLLRDDQGTPLFGPRDTERLQAFKQAVGAGYWQSVVTAIDVLSGFGSATLQRLAAAGVPIPGVSSDSGASTASDDSPENAEEA